ncbi:GTP cyclohydrolase II [Vibrio ishigakensis]|uniref:GTP cyclohydrolase II n=1 Tax=Vibrio ishigakensis TaxID=1481914 RepID=A0A0B8P1X1_9VIBR|nr:GTP cyclohydrolase II [Vibrio ishigakensis]
MADVRARVHLKVGSKSDIEAELLSFNGLKTEKEHVALIFKSADINQTAPIVRMHSECLTGDVFHSSRCDCGEQLDETINKMATEGGVFALFASRGPWYRSV